MYFASNLLALAVLPLMASSTPPSINYLHQFSQNLVKPARLIDAAQFDFAPYQVTNITLDCKRPNTQSNYSCALDCNTTPSLSPPIFPCEVTLHDPNSVRENNVTSCSCHHGWSWDGVNGSLSSTDWRTPVASYQICWVGDSTYFKSSVQSFEHPGNFSLEVAHTYHDDENFTVPWDYPTTIATGAIIIEYEEKKHHKNKICVNEMGPVNATVVGILD
ncbi:hypothetical protein QBC36DRAFT_308013 [Triangularia setosa]|uniref:Uncharacterized protein n=1 Tax=Triangularia setosa TaxID=2587417 RepID=A0AAN7ABL1_9PEZI|nr:hypothetical protein QBC36DRAFT_308013 [Podospora setosa]